jgi:hypothetical protein
MAGSMKAGLGARAEAGADAGGCPQAPGSWRVMLLCLVMVVDGRLGRHLGGGP